MERLIELTKRHKTIMDKKNILVSVYTNASGFLWSMMKVDSGTDLGWSDFNGDCEMSGTFTSYENALEDALNLIDKADLEKFSKFCKIYFLITVLVFVSSKLIWWVNKPSCFLIFKFIIAAKFYLPMFYFMQVL